MHFDHLGLGAPDRVQESDGRVSVGASVQNDAGSLRRRLLDPADQISFVVGLTKHELDLPLAAGLAQALLNV